jgi:hypothetical protein
MIFILKLGRALASGLSADPRPRPTLASALLPRPTAPTSPCSSCVAWLPAIGGGGRWSADQPRLQGAVRAASAPPHATPSSSLRPLPCSRQQQRKQPPEPQRRRAICRCCPPPQPCHFLIQLACAIASLFSTVGANQLLPSSRVRASAAVFFRHSPESGPVRVSRSAPPSFFL